MKIICLAAVFALLSTLAITPALANDDDRLENLNRKVFYINDRLDHYALRPAAVTYKKLMPNPLEKGVDNFFSNLDEVTNVLNDLLQGKFGQAAHDSGRFLLTIKW